MKLGRDAVPALSQTKAVNNQGKTQSDFLNYQNHELSFRQLQAEILRLRRQRTEDLITIGEQKDLIISLYSRINCSSEISPLKIAG